MSAKNYLQIIAILFLQHFAGAQAQTFTTCSNFGHFDVFIDVTPPAVDGGAIIVDANDDFPTEAITGAKIVPADFGDFAGGPYKTDDPGWVVDAGKLVDLSLIHI